MLENGAFAIRVIKQRTAKSSLTSRIITISSGCLAKEPIQRFLLFEFSVSISSAPQRLENSRLLRPIQSFKLQTSLRSKEKVKFLSEMYSLCSNALRLLAVKSIALEMRPQCSGLGVTLFERSILISLLAITS